MPNAGILWMAAGLLWVLDASINVSMEPFRAFVGDMLDERQRTRGYAFQTIFIGAGAVLASTAPWFLTRVVGISNVAAPGEIPINVRSEEHTSELQSLMRISYAVFCLKQKRKQVKSSQEFERAIVHRAL